MPDPRMGPAFLFIKVLPLTLGKVAFVDDSDFVLVSRFKWRAQKGRQTFYACRTERADGRPRNVFLHREITSAAPDIQVDHRDGDGLNNQRDNLRLATNAQNHQARMTRPAHFKSHFRGVYWHGQNHNWCAQIKLNYKKRHLGSFAEEADAARAYDAAARELFGEFAQLNFPG